MSFKIKFLGDISDVTKLAGFEYSKYIDYNTDGEIIALRALNIKNNQINLEDIQKIPKEISDKLPRSKLSINDIVLTYTGNSYGDSIIITEDNKYHLAPNIAKITPQSVYPLFLFAFIKSDLCQKQLSSLAVGSSQPTIPMKNIRLLEVPFPNYGIQKKIGDFINYFDELIYNNKKINQNLEKYILKIFQNWFVDYNFPNENNEPYTISKGLMKDSEIGLIPEKWKVDFLGSKNLCKILGSGIDKFENTKKYVATANVDNINLENDLDIITLDEKPSRANMQPIRKSVWFAKMKDSRKIIIVDDYSKDLLNNYIFSTGFCGLKCSNETFYYISSFILTNKFDKNKNNLSLGTTMQAINNTNIKKIKLVRPPNNILNKYNQLVDSSFKQIYYNNIENKKLTKLRDILLPKLMSGEIDLSKVEI